MVEAPASVTWMSVPAETAGVSDTTSFLAGFSVERLGGSKPAVAARGTDPTTDKVRLQLIFYLTKRQDYDIKTTATGIL